VVKKGTFTTNKDRDWTVKIEAEGLTAAWTGGVGVTVNPDFIIGPWDTKPTSGQLILSMGRGWVPVLTSSDHPLRTHTTVVYIDCMYHQHLPYFSKKMKTKKLILEKLKL
jgi:hypothetical protein